MGNGDEVRIDGRSIHQHADDTIRGLGTHQSNSQNVDRQQQFLESSTGGGAGSDEYAAVRNRTRHQMDDVDTSGRKLTHRTTETADEFINNVDHAAKKHIV